MIMKIQFARSLTATLLGALLSASPLRAGDATAPAVATAQVRSSTQIVVDPAFTGDDNGNGYTVIDISTNGTSAFDYYTLRYGGTPLWRIAAMPALPGVAHYVRVTHFDPDGVSGAAMQVLGPITTPASAPDAVSLSAAQARVRDTEIEVSCDVTNDANQNSTFYIEVATSASGPWIEKAGPYSAANPKRARVRSLEPGADYWVRVTVNDPDGVVGTNPQVLGPIRYTGAKNLAFNRPISADQGWGCCPDARELVDGRVQYGNWFYGFAWTGGLDGWSGGSPGIKQATVDLGAGATFDHAAVWLHDPQGTPLIWGLDVSDDGANWRRVYWNTNPVCRSLDEPLHNPYWADPGCAQEARFPTVTARYLRYLFDDRQLFNRIHGWAVELEVFRDPPKADLSLTAVATSNPVTVSNELVLTLAVSNAGPATATGVRLMDTLPAPLVFVSATTSQGSCAQAAGVVTCDLGSLVNGGTASVTIRARALCEASVTNVAGVTANEGDAEPGNNTVRDEAISIDPLYINHALNRAGSGFPSPLESSRGWGGGSYPWEIVDGAHSYNWWAHGLAFTGGHTDSQNPESGGYIESAGVRQATINFGADRTFEKVVIWHHGTEHTPANATLEYWNGSAWVNIPFRRVYGRTLAPGEGSGYSHSDEYYFAPVTGSQVRYSFDNRERNLVGTWNVHGWLYEFEALGRATPPILITHPQAGTNALPGVTTRIRWQANCPPDARWSIESIKDGVTNQLNLPVINEGNGQWHADWAIPCEQMAGGYRLLIRDPASGYAAVSGVFTIGLSLSLEFCVTWPDTACARQFVLQEADSPNGPWRDLAVAPLTLLGGKLGVMLAGAHRAKFHRLRQP
jgi:uncharacterized repeat protein (TIGR01451 family)